MTIKPLFDDADASNQDSTQPDESEKTIQSPVDPSHPKPGHGRNSPDGGATGYEKNSPDEFSSNVPDPQRRREAEDLGAEDRARGYVWPENPGERPGPDKRQDVDESGL
jgi:hypothetical protein